MFFYIILIALFLYDAPLFSAPMIQDTQTPSFNKNTPTGDPQKNQTVKEKKEDKNPLPTKTANYSKAYNQCAPRIRDLCLTSYCATFCKYRYGKWAHNPLFKEKECLERCKEYCDLDKQKGNFDGALHHQLQTQLQSCMKEMPTQKDPEGEDHLWIKTRAPDFKKMEDTLKKEQEKNKLKKKTKKSAKNNP